MLPKGTILHGNLRVDGYLSSGGFGNTYVVTHTGFNRKRAVKEFFMKGVSERNMETGAVMVSNAAKVAEFNDQLRKFKKEAQRIYNLNNEHIITVYELFDENDTAYYVMDYIDGETLAERIERIRKPLTESQAMDVLTQVLDALREVHSKGIWHLDIKPANIMIDRQGVVKLIDFGASKQGDIEQGGAARTSVIAYTMGYAPVEQIDKLYSKIGPWTDFYALGATLYHLLTCKKPPLPSEIFEDESPYKQTALPMPHVSVRMRELILWMMNPSRNKRPQSVNDILTFINPPKPAKQYEETAVKPTKTEETIIQEEDVTTPPVRPAVITEKRSKRSIWISLIVALSVIGLFLVYRYLPAGFYSTHPDDEKVKELPSPRQDIPRVVQQAIDDMVLVKGGTFTMGATSEQSGDADGDESPAHQVTLSDFYISKYEVTQKLWLTVMYSNPSRSIGHARRRLHLCQIPVCDNPSEFTGDLTRPVENVSWEDCQEFITKLNQMTGKNFRLPTEAEWEYAARGGNKSKGFKYSGSNNIHYVAWYNGNSGHTTHPVGQKDPNELGLYDMSGNVFEWCQDWYGDYGSESQIDPTGPSSGSDRVTRGGSWNHIAESCRVSFRVDGSSSGRNFIQGLRLAL